VTWSASSATSSDRASRYGGPVDEVFGSEVEGVEIAGGCGAEQANRILLLTMDLYFHVMSPERLARCRRRDGSGAERRSMIGSQ
jgi:hypothetical protein